MTGDDEPLRDDDVLYIHVYRLSWGRKRDKGMETNLPAFKNVIVPLMQDTDICEIVLTDTGDRCLFHYKDGEVLFPNRGPDGTFV
jgi:hypothetical protein